MRELVRPMVLALLLAGAPAPVMAESLAGSEWVPVTFGDVVVSDEVEQFVQFGDEGQVSGTGGCNRFTGSYTVDGTTLTIGPLAATRMMCPPVAMEREQAFFGAMDSTASFLRDGIALTLFDEAGTVLATFRQTDWD
ncbi:MAG: META domain-containing protein [Pseudomonadota bacterium]